MRYAALGVTDERAEATAVPETVRIMPLRRPIRSVIGPTASAMTAVATETSVETRDAVASSQPKLAEICGSRVPNMMKSNTAKSQAKKATIVAFRVARLPIRRNELVARVTPLSGAADMTVAPSQLAETKGRDSQ